MADLLQTSLTQLTSGLARREISPVELMRETLDRVDATSETLNAFVALRERDVLMADARAAEERIAAGDARPLEGVPLGVKDLEHAAGLVTTEGSLPFEARQHAAAVAAANDAQATVGFVRVVERQHQVGQTLHFRKGVCPIRRILVPAKT